MHIPSKSGQKAEMMKPRGRLAEESRSMKQIENFSPRGLKVLVVDDDPLCLMVLERMLRQCDYNVTTCNRVSQAISLVRENKDRFDLVMSEVYLPDEDGFKLLEIIGLTLDLPVIMMSGNGETDMVMKGVTHGACDYLIKPVRMEELRNIWQHVVRRRGRDYLREELGENDHDGKVVESSESTSKKRKDSINFDQSDEIIEDISSLKKSRVHWTVQLHQQFVAAVNHLGIDKAVPKKIIEIMGVHGLTRENVASHLQKYRLYLKRLSGSVPEPYPVASFQAAEDGKSGGTMQIQPGGKSVASSPGLMKGLNLGIGVSPNTGFGMSHIDQATLKSLEQYRAYEQKRAANRAQVLGGIGLPPSRQSHVGQLPDTKCGLQRMSSVDLSLIWKAHRDQSANKKSGTNVLDDMASQSFKNVVKLEDVQPEPMLRRRSGSRHSRAQSMSNILTSSHTTLLLPTFQNQKLTKTMLRGINELKPLESISWLQTTNAQDGRAEKDVDADLLDDLVEEYGISSLSPPTSVGIEAMSEVGIESEALLSNAPADISDYLEDDFPAANIER